MMRSPARSLNSSIFNDDLLLWQFVKLRHVKLAAPLAMPPLYGHLLNLWS